MRWIACAILVLAIAPSAHAQPGSRQPSASAEHFPRHTRPAPEAGPTPVKVLFAVLDIGRIVDVDQTVAVDFYLELGWHDARLALPEGAARGRVRPLAIDDLWHPFVQIVNQARLFRQLPQEVLVDDAGDCVYRQRYVGSVSVPLELRNFPFDQQKLAIQAVSAMTTADEVLFSFDERFTSRAGKFTIVDWEIGPATFDVVPYQLHPGGMAMAGFSASFPAKRYANYFILKIITPLVIIVAMSWVVFWIESAQLGARVGVATTSVLTLIAYRFSLGTLVPRVSYMTRLDVFILGATLLVFAALVEALATSTLGTHGRERQAARFNGWSRILFPVSLGLLLAISFL
jgi:hypothetical protein